LTDAGRQNLSQGNFNISYFQIGDSEVNYTVVPNYNQTRNNILMPAFNAQNTTAVPQKNKQNVKYPYYVQGSTGGTYGIPFMDSNYQLLYNYAGIKGFFTGSTGSWVAQTSSAYTITSNYIVDMTTLSGQTDIQITSFVCSTTTGTPSINDIVTIIYDGIGGCGDIGSYPILTYKIQNMVPPTGTTGTTYTLTLDRAVPNYTTAPFGSIGRVLIYPSGMTQLYDSVTPASYWETFDTNLETSSTITVRDNTVVWNMNIPWSVSPAGVSNTLYEDYTTYNSVTYLGTKEYLGYQEPSGQTLTSNNSVYYYNSFNEGVVVPPAQQKAIAIIHYTNQDIDNVYGEKFATNPYDPQNPNDNIGLARHFKLSIPTLMWHKSTGGTIGQTFYIDPPTLNLSSNAIGVKYVTSSKNLDMNDPGIRYYDLWDDNVNSVTGLPNRVGKVFPDQEIVVIDDDEIIAAMSYKANRNWTLPAPKLSLLTPNTCFTNGSSAVGLMSGSTQKLWVTYRMDSTTGFTNSLHCNYYSTIYGPSVDCNNSEQNVAVRFGDEFPFLTLGTLNGYSADSLKLLCQLIEGESQPSPTDWREIDVTDQLSATTIGGYLTVSGITGTTFQIDNDSYNAAPIYDLGDYIDIPTIGETDVLNFGDEYYFYGNIETDISATIYEMRYLINLGRNQFTNTSNPTWTSGTTSYFTEIGLFDSNKDLVVVSKFQSPQLRQGIQQLVVKLDF
jgi:hypothetical protein